MRTNVLNDLSNVVKKGTILAGSAAAAVDSCAAGSTTLAEYPGNHPVITQLSPRNHPLLDAIWKHVAMIFAVLTLSIANIGMAWGASGDVLFNQGFGSATEVAYSANTERSYSTSSTLSGLVGTGDNLFQGAQCNAKTNCGIAINTTSGANSYTTAGTFQAYANNTSFKWALYKTTNFATTAPTAIKFEMDVTPKYIDNKQALAVVVGSGFSVGTSKPGWTAGYTGFNIITNSTSTGKIYIGKVGGNTSIQTTTGMTSGTNYHITWVINATGEDLTYTGPDSKSYTLATAKWDMWVGTTRIISGQDRTKTGSSDFSGTTMQNLYIGNDVSGKHEVIIDNVKVTDLTPSCDAADLTASNITSNGDQEAGTGITFSKVGSPASGDTWYWQTSATGTDKTRNASSSYITATTAGSYTVYLRAYNTAADCWGKAASMTNTIYPAPSAMIHNTFAVNDAWGSTIATQDKTNITGLNAMAAVGESVGSGSNKDGLTQKIPSQSSEDASKYMSLSFNVASGKQLNVTSVVFDEQPVTGTGTFKVSISDNQGSTTKTQTIASDAAGTKHTLTLDGDIVGSFKGTVTVKVWAYGWGEGYRFGDYFYINGTVTDAAACSAPSSVSVAPTNANGWRYSLGETIDLTCTAEGGTGTKTYQWQKYIGSTWTDINTATNASAGTARLQIANCTSSDGGSYRCVVSTGATCSLESDGYWVRVFTLNGAYYGGSDTENAIVWTDANTGVATVHLNASSTYMFKVTDNDGRWFGYGENNYIIQPVALDCGTENQKLRLLTGPEGDYTFTINVQHAADVSPYVNIATGYPTVSHPNSGYMYITKWWDCYIHYWEGTNNDLTAWGSDPKINSDRYVNICGTDYWYFPVIDTYNKFIAKNNTGDATDNNTTGNQVSTDHGGKYITHDGSSWGWQPFSTYTITYTGNGGGGSMSATSGICPDADQAITSNAFTAPTGCASFAHWTANVAVKVGDATVAAGNPIANGATIQDINSDITLTAVWKLAAPTITDKGDNTFSISGSIGGASYYYTIDGTTPTTSSSLYSAAVDFSAGEADITAKAIAHKDGYVDSEVASQACTYHAPAVACYEFTPATSGSAPSKGDVINGTGSGGTMVAGTGQSYTANGLKFESSGDYRYVTVTLDNNLKEGSVIAVTMWMDGTSSNRGLYLQTSAGTQKAEWKFTADSENHQFSYTVEAGDGLINTNVFRLARINNVYLKSVTVSNCGDAVCTTPTTAFGNGAYTVGGSALDLSTLISGKQGSGTITYTVKNANGTGAAIDGSNFTATSAGTATVTATQAANGGYCEKVMDATITVSAAGPSGDCITITNFATSNVNNTCGDGNGKIFYGYKGSVSDANALTITSNDGNDHGQNSGAEMRLTYNKLMRIYANNTTNAAPATFSNVTSVSFKWKFIASGNSGNTELTSSYTVKVGSTTIANAVSITGKTKDGYQTVTIDNLAQLSGYVEIKFSGSSSSYNVYIDDIEICTSSLPACTTPILPTLTDKTVCEGGDAAAAWDATITNSGSLASGETVAYSWVKKGGSTPVSSVATYQPTDVTEAMAGTYVVTATVSADGKASKSASQEVELSVTEETEVTNITADKATVYPGNSVTLTATANVTPNSWQWYTCASAEGAGAAIISGAESASYTIASAGAAGTYYYKAVATGSCGTAERVYTLIVSAASECEKYFWFVYAADATSNGVINNRDNFFGSSPKTGSSNSSTYKFTLDGTEYTATRNTGDNTFSISFTVPEGSTATLALNCKGSSSKPIYLIPTSGDPVLITDNSSNAAHVVENIAAGTYKVGAKTDASASWTLAGMAVQVCTASTCTDATPTITAANTTVCVGSELSISSTGYETGATFQWQKLNSSTSTWDNISGATSATYTVATAAAEHAGSYRLVATKGCARTSNTVTISVPSVPVFGSLGGARSVMTTSSLSITDVEASDATSYIWYKSANNTFEPGTDEQIGTSKDLIIGAVSEAANSTFYLFCVASNSCGSTTSGAITVNVTAYVEEDCATRDNMASAEFGFVNTSAGQGSYSSTACWTMNSNSKYLTYTAPEGKYFKTAKVTIASNSESKASYNWSTNGGTSYTAVSLTVNSTLTERTINLSAHGNVNAIQIGRNFDSKGSSGGTLYVSKICFEYTEACTATTVTPSESSVNYEMGGEWSNPTFTLSVAGTLTYSSSNEDIASVDDDGTVTFNGEAGTVTITASYAGDETYCASTGSYTITVSCPGGAPKVEADGTTDMSGCNSSVTLHAKKQDGTAFADGTYQWFRNGEEIDGATSSSYTAKQAGTYTVARTNGTGCTSPSTNSAIVTSETTEPEVERLVPFQYYHVDKTYSDQMKMRHLFAVKNSGTLDGKHFKMYVSRNGGAATDVTSSAALVVVPNRDGQHIDTVMVDLNELIHKYSENDEVVYTCKAIDCSGNVSDVYKNTITMRVIDATPTLALIISSDSVGDDFFRYKAENLQEQTGGSAWSGEWPLYTYLKTRYNITPVNGYADFYKYNYEPFDILLLTDFPKTKPYGKPKNDNQKKQNTLARKALDDMADLCDFRPLLSFKTHMVQEETDLGHVSKWQAKGFTSNAVVPKTCQLRADIVCYAHPMFASLSTASSEINENKDNEAQKVFTLLSGEGYESGKVDGKEPKKGIQGFEVAAADNFVIIAYSHFDATATDLTDADAGKVHWTDKGKDRNLVAMCERQANIEARMILFSLNAGAHSKLTNAGMAVVDSCLQYLLDSDPLHVSDCSLVFDNNEGNGDGNWNTATNWLPTREEIPHANLAAHIKAPCTVNIPNASALNIRIEDEGSLIIPQGAALMVVNTIKRQDGRELSPTEVGDIHIGSNEDGNGTLIFNNNDGDTKARVDMYSTAKADAGLSAAASTWQYIGTPHNDIGNAQRNYYDSWLYQYDTESQGWTVIENGGPLVPFRGYCVTHPAAPVVFDMEGTLVATTSYDISVPANKYVVAANSWVAPIDINAITSDDMEGFSDQAIYFFNTGSDPDKEGELDGGDRWAAGTYVSVPIHSAPYTGDDHIPSMQGFYVWSETAGTLHLDYEKHVRGTTRDNILSGRMHAPRRAVAENSEPNVLKIFARGSRYDDRLIVLEREDFTRRYESGWDGEAWGGSDLSPMVYITNEAGVDEAVSAIPEFEGTVITFKAGEDNDYHFDFIYDGEESLYLFDTENSTYTQIMTGESYYFSTDDKAPHSRFILTRRGPQIATGVGEVPSDQVQGTKAKKLLIENKMYILLNGALYDATGKAVK